MFWIGLTELLRDFAGVLVSVVAAAVVELPLTSSIGVSLLIFLSPSASF